MVGGKVDDQIYWAPGVRNQKFYLAPVMRNEKIDLAPNDSFEQFYLSVKGLSISPTAVGQHCINWFDLDSLGGAYK